MRPEPERSYGEVFGRYGLRKNLQQLKTTCEIPNLVGRQRSGEVRMNGSPCVPQHHTLLQEAGGIRRQLALVASRRTA